MKFKFDLKKIESFLMEQKQKVTEKLENLTPEQISKLKKGLILGGCTFAIIMIGVAVSSIPHKENPVSEELLVEAMVQEKAPEPEVEEEPEEEVEALKVCEEGCTLEPGHEGACVVKKEDIQVVLKTTSMERDLKVKFVNQKTGKVITGAKFQMKLTDSAKKVSEYSDTDADGIIWVKDIEGGNYTVEMLEMEGYVTAKLLTAEVKKKIEYKVVEVSEEVKKESEIVVSQEDAEFSGADKDESTSNSQALKDTVEYVESACKDTVEKVQKTDEFGTPMYEKYLYKNGVQVYSKQKTDDYGTPMYEKIISEPAKYHVDQDQDGKCDRCAAAMPAKECTHPTVNNGICTDCNKLVDESKHTCSYDDSGKCICGKTKPADPEPTPDPDPTPDPEPTPNPTPDPEPTTPEGDSEQDVTPSENTAPSNDGQLTDPQAVVFKDFRKNLAYGVIFRSVDFLGAAEPRAAENTEKIVYDTTSKPIYDTTSAPVYDTTSSPKMEEKVVGKTYYGWQTIDGATYYFDKNGNKVTGQQVIQGVSYTFSSEGVRSGTIGIDVSKYQKNINWTKIKNAGINFAIIRCGYRGYGSGVLVEDPMFASHIKGAKAAGLRVGVYFFSQAVNEAEAVEEASMAVSLAKKYGINMPIAIDSEYANGGKGRADGLSKADRTAVTKAFCNTVKSAGYTPMVYASKAWFGSHLDVSQLSGYRIWVAHYAEKCGYTGRYDIWQNTSKGKVDGYSGYLDMNISSI